MVPIDSNYVVPFYSREKSISQMTPCCRKAHRQRLLHAILSSIPITVTIVLLAFGAFLRIAYWMMISTFFLADSMSEMYSHRQLLAKANEFPPSLKQLALLMFHTRLTRLLTFILAVLICLVGIPITSIAVKLMESPSPYIIAANTASVIFCLVTLLWWMRVKSFLQHIRNPKWTYGKETSKTSVDLDAPLQDLNLNATMRMKHPWKRKLKRFLGLVLGAFVVVAMFGVVAQDVAIIANFTRLGFLLLDN